MLGHEAPSGNQYVNEGPVREEDHGNLLIAISLAAHQKQLEKDRIFKEGISQLIARGLEEHFDTLGIACGD